MILFGNFSRQPRKSVSAPPFLAEQPYGSWSATPIAAKEVSGRMAFAIFASFAGKSAQICGRGAPQFDFSSILYRIWHFT